ncbi:hypothetical protein DOM22_05365 [Bdellovibrio sp. ZAP7]|uniref:hypothetical protein n=1 Tax=Bdellovibrio sp. ZAP7 TaxID=2231053 RepID=UPI001158AEB0|nr:hypothetical protein [Bdellovibrio sp. ZAP7]QDK44630.1 hypothetical protein DOM22_05365 [Bdellovibrio sp. ZAP7]
MENAEAVAKINDRLRKAMSLGQLTIELSEVVSSSPVRPEIIKAVREFKSFDSEIDLSGDHSLGVFLVADEPYVFRYTYGDDRYDYGKEIGKRVLSVFHLAEFRSLKLGKKIQASARKMLDQEGA